MSKVVAPSEQIVELVAKAIVDGLQLKTTIGDSERRLATSVITIVIEEHRREYNRWAREALCL